MYSKKIHPPLYRWLGMCAWPTLLCLASVPLSAQPTTTLEEIVVSATPLRDPTSEIAAPTTVISGQRLNAERSTTLGETLTREVGISSSYFGPNASRPIIRGLEGERLRMLNNGMGAGDASGASPDHAVTLEPLLLDRVEILRGPAALQFGGGAIGGAVNVLDGRIPTEKNLGFQGTLGSRFGGAEDDRSNVLRLDSGTQGMALHVDAFDRQTRDLKIPGFARSAELRAISPLPPGEEEIRGTLPNSSSHTQGGALGGSVLFDTGYIGTSVSEYRSNYGTVAEPDVRIGLLQQRWDWAGELRQFGWLERIQFKYSDNDYRHTEYANNSPDTYFRNRGREVRIDAQHSPWTTGTSQLRGSIGLSQQKFIFSTLGEEAYLPTTDNQLNALYWYEELTLGSVKLNAGVRREQNTVTSQSSENPNFSVAQEKHFQPTSTAWGINWKFAPGYALAGTYSATQRSPNYQELFANGPHVATNAWEIGNPNLGMERGQSWDLSLRKTHGAITAAFTVFQQNFSHFITLMPNGNVNTSGSTALDEFEFRDVAAKFRGAEFESRWRIVNRQPTLFDIEFRGDTVQASNTSTGEPLPRITPSRLQLSFVYRDSRYSARLDFQKVQAQERVAENELPTAGYLLANLYSSLRVPFGKTELECFLKLNNLFNQEIRYHTSFLKDQAPLGKRNAMLGIQLRF